MHTGATTPEMIKKMSHTTTEIKELIGGIDYKEAWDRIKWTLLTAAVAAVLLYFVNVDMGDTPTTLT